MTTFINTNTTASNAAFNLNNNSSMLSMDIQRLSTGLRINSAADDAAGLVVTENMSAQISGLQQATRNTNDATNMSKTAEGALSQVQNLLISMRQLAVQASNLGVNDSTDIQADQTQIASAIQSINQISTNTQFGTKYLLNGASSAATTYAPSTATYNGTSSAFSIQQTGAWSTNGALAGTLAANSAITNITASNGTATTVVSGAPASWTSSNVNFEGSIAINGKSYSIGGTGNNITLAQLNEAIAASGYVASQNSTSGALTLTNQTVGAQAVANPSFSGLNAFTSATATSGGVTFNNGGTNGTLATLTTNGVAGVTGTASTFTTFSASLQSGKTPNSATDTFGGTITIGSSGAISLASVTGIAGINTAIASTGYQITGESAFGLLLFSSLVHGTAVPTIDLSALTETDSSSAAVVTAGGWASNTLATSAVGTADTTAVPAVITLGLNGNAGSLYGGALTLGSTTYTLNGNNNTLAALNTAISASGYVATVDPTTKNLVLTQSTASAVSTLPTIDASTLKTYTGSVQSGGYASTNVGEGPGASFVDNGSVVNSTYTDQNGQNSTFYFSNGFAFSIANIPTGGISVNGSLSTAAGKATTGTNLEFQVGANEGQTVSLGIGSTAANQLGNGASSYTDASGNTQTVLTDSVADINVTTFKGAQDAIAVLDKAISNVSTIRANLGAFQSNVLQSNAQSLGIATTNLQAAQATISNTDMAATVVDYTKNQILVQAATSALAYANQMPQSILKLLQ